MPGGLTALDMQNMRLTGEQQTNRAIASLHSTQTMTTASFDLSGTSLPIF